MSHEPQRYDDVDRWLKRQQQQYITPCGNPASGWHIIGMLLDDYRKHADTGTPLDYEIQASRSGKDT